MMGNGDYEGLLRIIHMILVVSLIMKLEFGHFTTSGIGWDNVFFLNVPLVYFGMAYIHDHTKLQGTQTSNRIPYTLLLLRDVNRSFVV